MTKLSHAERSKITRRTNGRAKAYERRVAKFFGTKRTPLSGSNSGHTHSDTLHPRLYIEVKSAQANKGSNAWVWQAVHGLPPLTAPIHGGMYVMHSSVLDDPWSDECEAISMPAGVYDCFACAESLARDETKFPLLALCTKGGSGFWLVGPMLSIIAAARERALVEST